MPNDPPVYEKDADYFKIRDGEAGVIHKRHYELAKRRYDMNNLDDRGFLTGLKSDNNGHFVLCSEKTSGIDLIFERKEDNIWGITDGLYELIFGKNVDPERDLRDIYKKVISVIGIDLAPILNDGERDRFRMIRNSAKFS